MIDFRRDKRRDETWQQMQARIIAETSVYITEALRHPELTVRIPMIPVGSGRFPPSLTRAFWEPVLFD